MTMESISRLADLSGKSRATVVKRLQPLKPTPDGPSLLYESREALPYIFCLDNQSDLKLSAERARLARHQANKTSLEEALMCQELIPADEVQHTWEGMVANARARHLSLPSKSAHLVIAADSFTEVEEILKDQVYEALNELATG